MEEKRLSPFWKFGCLACILIVGAAIAWFAYTVDALGHDKSRNTDIAYLWQDARGVPLGVVIPANNAWMQSAFVADTSHEKLKAVSLLILDDHYRSNDPDYSSESGVIGDEISVRVLCSVPAQTARLHIRLDAVVQKRIAERCASGNHPFPRSP